MPERRTPSDLSVPRYPQRAIRRAIDAMELAYSYLRDEKPLAAEKLDEAIHYLRRAEELHAESRRKS